MDRTIFGDRGKKRRKDAETTEQLLTDPVDVLPEKTKNCGVKGKFERREGFCWQGGSSTGLKSKKILRPHEQGGAVPVKCQYEDRRNKRKERPEMGPNKKKVSGSAFEEKDNDAFKMHKIHSLHKHEKPGKR